MRIRRGGVVVIPTDTLYGLAADPFQAAAIARVFEVKGRAADQPIPLVAADMAQVEAHLALLTETGRRLAAAFWPGPLTLLVAAPRTLAAAVSAGTGRVGVRVPDNLIAQSVCLAAGHPVTATSANRSGEPATADPDDVERALGDRVDLLLDGGVTRGGAPSTIVDITTPAPSLVREGAIPWTRVETCAAAE